ncbi:MAG TPA: hypothetical protein VJU84_08710 [Pyrinomonadaceae bacterium]|nr:hypothetical protein [Pyrinomonadaceae bacterium]
MRRRYKRLIKYTLLAIAFTIAMWVFLPGVLDELDAFIVRFGG